MAPRIVDPTKFLLLGSVVDWTLSYRREAQNSPPPQQIAAERGLHGSRVAQLRWVTDPALGYPTAPFVVWRRPSEPARSEAPINYGSSEFLGTTLIVFDQPRVFVRAELSGNSGFVMAFAGAPYASPMISPQTVTPAQTEYVFSAPAIQCLLISPGVALGTLTGLDGEAAQDLDWKQVEIVGLPVDSSFDNVLHLDEPQGLVGAPQSPPDAALDRFRRGAPFYGWRSYLDTGAPAPAWQLADPKAMLQVVTESMLPLLRDMVDLPAEQQSAFTTTQSLASPNGNNPTAVISPLSTLIYGAATDPLASLITGFGTAFEAPSSDQFALAYIPNRFDYMVTATYDNGTNHEPGPLEYAAIVFAPGPAPRPPTPTGVAATVDGLAAPIATDFDWTGVIRVGWDRLGDDLPMRVGSYALARTRLAPAGGVEAIMDRRLYDTALQPIGASTSAALAGSGRLTALDDRARLATAPNPNQLSYGVAQQDLFGQWSDWQSAGLAVGEPPVGIASLIVGSWDVAPATAVCPGTLTIDLAWNWASRRPARIDLVARMYPQARLDDPPGDLSVPIGIAPSLAGGSGTPLTIDFDSAGAATVVVGAGLGASIQYFDEQATSLSFGVQGAIAGPRRYRLTISGFGLDYSGTGAIGMALWARGTEARVPGRIGAWSASPLIASAADPRPPVLTIEHEDVLLTSMPDASGEYHARLQWPAAPGAVGYFAYSCSETDLLEACGRGDPAFSATLRDRLVSLRDAYRDNPTRRVFTRVNTTPVAETSLAVTLPRGTKDIHLFVVLGLSAGQVESAWPDTSDPDRRKRPIAYAAPHVVAPNPPTIEVVRRTDPSVTPTAYQASFRLGARAGVAVGRIDLYRTRVSGAAIDVDSMGPPIASITGSSATVTVTPNVSSDPGEGQPLARVDGIDAVAGSWQPVYYRAVAWAADDPTRGQYGGRSQPSTIRQAIVPPPGNPDLAPLVVTTPVGGTPLVHVDTTTAAPVTPTGLGPHKIEAEVIVTHDDGTSETLYRYPAAPLEGTAPDTEFDHSPQTPPATGTSGLWRAASTAGGTAVHLSLARAAYADQLAVRVRITDPLGRLTEQVVTVPPTNPVVAPDITNVQIVNIVGRGRVLSFDTSVPDEVAGMGPYRVHIALSEISPPPLPPLPLPPTVQVTEDIGAIAADHAGDNIFTDPAAIPLRQIPGTGGTRTIGAVLRTAGALRVDVIAPDGTQATMTRMVM
jgi:hypothetical protein